MKQRPVREDQEEKLDIDDSFHVNNWMRTRPIPGNFEASISQEAYDNLMENIHPTVKRRRGYTTLSIHMWTKEELSKHTLDSPSRGCFEPPDQLYRENEFPWTLAFAFKAKGSLDKHKIYLKNRIRGEFQNLTCSRCRIIDSGSMIEAIERDINGEKCRDCYNTERRSHLFSGGLNPLAASYPECNGVLRVLIVADPRVFFHEYHEHNDSTKSKYYTSRSELDPPPEWVLRHIKTVFFHGLEARWCMKGGAPPGTFKLEFKTFS